MMHAPLARHIAGRYARRGEPQEDIEQAAMVGLVKAINRFDPEVGQRFVAYAAPTMTGEVKRHFRDRTWTMRMPRQLQELRLVLRNVRQDFLREHGRAPTVPEVAELLGVSEEEAIELVVDRHALRPMIEKLPERQRTILLYRFFGNKTQTEIAELMDISQMHVSRLISRSLADLRTVLLEED
jgi:RNA polymerase sigma-B factor